MADIGDNLIEKSNPASIMRDIAYRSDLIMQIMASKNNAISTILKHYEMDTDKFAFVSALATLFVMERTRHGTKSQEQTE